MNARQPSYRPPTLPPACDSCQYCPNCDPKPDIAKHIIRFCEHGQGRNFVELKDCAASGHECIPTAPLRRSAGSGQQSSNPRTAQIGQMPSPQPQHPQGYITHPANTYENNPAGQHPEPRYRGHSHRPQVDQFPQVNGRAGFLFERTTAVDRAKAHWGLNYDSEPRFEGMQIYRDVNVGGHYDTHSGNNYGLAHLKAGQQAKHGDHFEMMDRDDFSHFPGLEDFENPFSANTYQFKTSPHDSRTVSSIQQSHPNVKISSTKHGSPEQQHDARAKLMDVGTGSPPAIAATNANHHSSPKDDDLGSTHMSPAGELLLKWKALKVKLALKFAYKLMSSVQSSPDHGQMSQIPAAQVQQYIRHFSIMLKSSAMRREEMAACHFIRSQRKLISRFVSQPIGNDDEKSKDLTGKGDVNSMGIYDGFKNLENKDSSSTSIQNWLETLELDEQGQINALSLSGFLSKRDVDQSCDQKDHGSSVETESHDDTDFGDLEPDIANMETFLVNNSCWDWLKVRVEVHTRATSWPLCFMEPIVQTLSGIPASATHHGYFSTRFVVGWHPRAFLRTQFDDNNNWRLDNVIVLTGSNGTVQACTCSEYLSMMWPTMGVALLRVLEDDLQADSVTETKHIFPDGSNVRVVRDPELPECLVIQACATVPCLVDIAEQLAWLGEALSASDRPSTTCHRFASCTLWPIGKSADDHTDICITYGTKMYDSLQQGCCWSSLFSSPSIAYDFPARSRHHDEIGMEMTSDVMITLGEITSATSFNSRYMLKGFSSAFYPTQHLVSASSMTWHFLCKEDGSYLPFLEASLGCVETSAALDQSWMQSTRHFVGWTPASFYNMGTKDTDYARIIQPPTDLGSNLVLKQMTFGFSQYIAANATIGRGRSHHGVFHQSTPPYKRMIRQAKMSQIVLYDTRERRAWLTDGATALLHLLCCKLAAQKSLESPYSNLQDVTQHFQYADTTNPNASEAVLCRQENQDLVLDTDPDYCVKDEVRYLFERLQELRKAHDKNPDEWQIRLTDRNRLEGYSFRDVVDDALVLGPTMVYLKESSGSWVDFVRDTKAVVLMARGFGELISSRHSPCPSWMTVPTGKDYLVARVDLLRKIAESKGREEEFPFWLTHNTRWHKGKVIFEACSGQPRRTSDICCTRVQEIRSAKLTAGRKFPLLASESTQGAVVFGQNLRMQRVTRVFHSLRGSAAPRQAPALEQTNNDERNPSSGQSATDETSSPNEIGERSENSSSGSIRSISLNVSEHDQSSMNGLERSGSLSDTPPTSLTTTPREHPESSTSSTGEPSHGEASMHLEGSASEPLGLQPTAMRRKQGRVNLRGVVDNMQE